MQYSHLLILTFFLGQGSSKGPPRCRAADALTSRTLDELRGMVTSTDSLQRAYRDSVRVPPGDGTSVHLVTDEQTCVRAAEAYNLVWKTPERRRQLYVYRVSNRYIVEDPTQGGGEYRGLQVFDLQWRYLSTILTF
jgi:hypothetical protein